jgi:hypothetical protein
LSVSALALRASVPPRPTDVAELEPVDLLDRPERIVRTTADSIRADIRL